MPKVDIIIPAYNAAKYLTLAIESVIAQTFDDWRILLVDDGSTDNTPELVAPFIQQLGPKLKYIRQANAGLPAARNTAIRNSSAELLALLDADDIWLPCRLAESVQCFENRPEVGLSYGLISRIGPDGVIFETFAGNPEHAEGRIAPYIYMRRVELPCPTMTFRRKCVDEVGMFDETMRATEDRDLWLRIAQRYEVAFVPKVLALYRTSPSSMSTEPDRMLKAQLQFIAKHYGSPGCGRVARRRALGRVYKQHADALGNRRELWGALKSAVRGMVLYPLDIGNARTAGSMLLRCTGLR
ncbi:MAG TPA: glycosyltransferase family A protein [Acidobacteriaceae bacterium]|jgi:glycosyltransferase involved in cell wall biosynthesis